MTLGGKRPRSRARLAAWVAVALALAGCGGGSSSSSGAALSAAGKSASPAKRAAAYRSGATALCDAMRDRLRHLGPAPAVGSGSAAAGARLLPRAAGYFRGREADVSTALKGLSKLPPPPPGERPAIERLLGTMRRTDVLERNQFRSALRGFRPGFLRASAALQPALRAMAKAARGAHLSACAVGSPR